MFGISEDWAANPHQQLIKAAIVFLSSSDSMISIHFFNITCEMCAVKICSMKVKCGETRKKKKSKKILQTQLYYFNSGTQHNLGIETAIAVNNYEEI